MLASVWKKPYLCSEINKNNQAYDKKRNIIEADEIIIYGECY